MNLLWQILGLAAFGLLPVGMQSFGTPSATSIGNLLT